MLPEIIYTVSVSNKDHVMKKSKLPGVIYIAGYGRSGSTILDMLLGMHPTIFGAGEVTSIFDQWLQNGICSCKRSCKECVFWTEVIDCFHSILPGVTLEEASRITREVENVRNIWKLIFGLRTTQNKRYRNIWRAMMQALAEVSEAPIIVDSSKNTHPCAGRVIALSKLAQLDVKVIHLIRDPRAVMWSALRGSNKSLEAGKPARLWGGAFRTLLGWIAVNLNVHAMRISRGRTSVLTRYEDLMNNQIIELKRIARTFNLDMQPLLASVKAGCQLEPSHGVSGNRLRRQGAQRLREDEGWKSNLPSFARLVAMLSWPLAINYGYRVGSKPKQKPTLGPQ